jgi:hypothetical protein
VNDTTASTGVSSRPWLKPWKPGQSGNPSGKSAKQREMEALAKDKSVRALERILELMESEDERIAFMAAKEVLDRAFGRPAPVKEDEKVDTKGLTINIIRYSDGNQPPAQLESTALSVRSVALPRERGQEGPGGLPS